MKPIHVLHITAHLGGGVGKVLSRLVEESNKARDGILHTIVALEALEKSQFADHLTAHGGKLIVCPCREELNRLVSSADIVQVEWWHHPIVAAWLCSRPLPEMRLIVWSHVSGLFPPQILPGFVETPHRFLFTSPCSYEHPALKTLSEEVLRRTACVFSSGGFADFPVVPQRSAAAPMRYGYVGTLNFSKLHPDLISFLAAVDLPDFKLSMIGDPTTADELLQQARKAGIPQRVELAGYSTNIRSVLANLDVFIYLLNPLHYGTTENALLEAMAMGVVPIVLDNPAERQLVIHGESGLIVDSPEKFAAALQWLNRNPSERLRLAENAATTTRDRFSQAKTHHDLHDHYQAVAKEAKRRFDFTRIFGKGPADWFRACQDREIWRFPDDNQNLCVPSRGPHYLYEANKSSVFHYARNFPEDIRLGTWAHSMSMQQESRHIS